MTRRTLCTVAAATLAAVLVGGPVNASEGSMQRDALDRFQMSVLQYMAVRETAVQHLAPVEISTDLREIWARQDARAAAIVLARPAAARGDIFDGGVSELFRARIAAALTEHRYTLAEIVMNEEGEETGGVPAVVNGRFLWSTAVATPPCVIAALPPLPPELQYRFVGEDLALVDTEVSLIIDVLPLALGR